MLTSLLKKELKINQFIPISQPNPAANKLTAFQRCVLDEYVNGVQFIPHTKAQIHHTVQHSQYTLTDDQQV